MSNIRSEILKAVIGGHEYRCRKVSVLADLPQFYAALVAQSNRYLASQCTLDQAADAATLALLNDCRVAAHESNIRAAIRKLKSA